MGTSGSGDEFARTYIAAWSTTDHAERSALIDRLYAEDAGFYADEPGDAPVECHGRAEIMANITQVNQRLTQGGGLSTAGTGVVENHDLVKVSWQMTTADGDVALTGMNILTRDASGLISRDHIFIG